MTLHLHFIVLIALTVATALVYFIFRFRNRVVWAAKQGKRNPAYTVLEYEKSDFPSFWIKWVAFYSIWILVVILIILAIPFQPKYWFLTHHEGTIATISNRFVEGTGDISGSTYTLTLEGDPTPRVVTDSRILGLEVGDRVDLTCSLEWVYGGSDRSNCYMRSF